MTIENFINGIPKVIDSIAEGSDANLRHQMKNVMANMLKLAHINKRQALLNLVLADTIKEEEPKDFSNIFGDMFGGK